MAVTLTDPTATTVTHGSWADPNVEAEFHWVGADCIQVGPSIVSDPEVIE